MGAVAQFMTFGGGLVAMAVMLKSLDRLLYSLDETRDERLRKHQMHHRALMEQQRMLQEQADASSSS